MLLSLGGWPGQRRLGLSQVVNCTQRFENFHGAAQVGLSLSILFR